MAEPEQIEQIKAAIRRRRFGSYLQSGTAPPAELAAWFVVCPECGGSGRFSETETDASGRVIAEGHGPCDVDRKSVV